MDSYGDLFEQTDYKPPTDGYSMNDCRTPQQLQNHLRKQWAIYQWRHRKNKEKQ